MATVKKTKKYQTGGGVKPTADSTSYYKKQGDIAAKQMANAPTAAGLAYGSRKIAEADANVKRQKLKGKPGYDANGYPVKKKTGGKVMKKSSSKKCKYGCK